ncbi:Exportin-1, repeat 2 [Dillenia turbinata]|uniref:Exportin-1, repeat 2 n=1 Tax=Dillenia turbinata TaxID=194707 RepID=A0AAN8W289_9MAGN
MERHREECFSDFPNNHPNFDSDKNNRLYSYSWSIGEGNFSHSQMDSSCLLDFENFTVKEISWFDQSVILNTFINSLDSRVRAVDKKCEEAVEPSVEIEPEKKPCDTSRRRQEKIKSLGDSIVRQVAAREALEEAGVRGNLVGNMVARGVIEFCDGGPTVPTLSNSYITLHSLYHSLIVLLTRDRTRRDGLLFVTVFCTVPMLELQRQLYAGPMSKLRLLMICRMAKLEEVLIIEDENGNIVCETMKDNDVLVQYKIFILNLNISPHGYLSSLIGVRESSICQNFLISVLMSYFTPDEICCITNTERVSPWKSGDASMSPTNPSSLFSAHSTIVSSIKTPYPCLRPSIIRSYSSPYISAVLGLDLFVHRTFISGILGANTGAILQASSTIYTTKTNNGVSPTGFEASKSGMMVLTFSSK